MFSPLKPSTTSERPWLVAACRESSQQRMYRRNATSRMQPCDGNSMYNGVVRDVSYVLHRPPFSSALTDREKLDYIEAVSCLMRKPSISPPEIVPGARSRYDDFVATHINQTLTIHMTGNFLSWHRYFVHTWETALRDECGYKGYQPYWNWGKSAMDPINSPYMDGSALSQGGNGAFAAHNCSRIADSVCIPPGQGGGCVESGPYGKMIANISANDPVLVLKEDPIVVGTMMSYGPRCVRRDISPWVTSQWMTDNVSRAHPFLYLVFYSSTHFSRAFVSLVAH